MDTDRIESALLREANVPHAFFLRNAPVEDTAFGFPLFQVTQVHGDSVVTVLPDSTREAVRCLEADGVATLAPSMAVGVRTADCVPVLIADRNGNMVAAVHAGWRGIARSIVERAADVFAANGSSRSSLVAAIGPHIRPCCFEVGDEVIDALDAASGTSTRRPGMGTKPHADMAAAVVAQLRRAGVTAVDDVGGCTYCDGARFYSYRRDGGGAGRLISAIAQRSLAKVW